jgi:hypothetical protein
MYTFDSKSFEKKIFLLIFYAFYFIFLCLLYPIPEFGLLKYAKAKKIRVFTSFLKICCTVHLYQQNIRVFKKTQAYITDNQIQRYNSELKLMFGQSRLSNKKK